jgi:hypothetical protein
LDHFVNALRDFLGVTLSEADGRLLFSHFTANWNEGKIEWKKFLKTLAGELSEARSDAVRQTYNKLNEKAPFSVDDLAKTFDASGNKDVKSGLVSQEERHNEYVSGWLVAVGGNSET